MDIFDGLGTDWKNEGDSGRLIKTITMHTTGEPTRIVVYGYPELIGQTLLEKRQYAKEKYDHVRQRLMHEPRGHRDMYGAVLVAETELTRSGEADIGVLFMHNEGYSTMCGHATIALGRFLIDTQDKSVFPRRDSLKFDQNTSTILLRLHAPCGIVQVTVPTVLIARGENEHARSDPSRPVSFLSVPSFTAGVDLQVDIPRNIDWRSSSGPRNPIRFDIAYGGAFYAILSASELGFSDLRKLPVPGSQGYKYDPDVIRDLDDATKKLKALISVSHQHLIQHPQRELNHELKDLEFLYGIIVVDDSDTAIKGKCSNIENCKGSDVNLTFFASQQLDRSPTGSGVSARIALSITKNELRLGESWVYHSVVSIGVVDTGNEGVFLGRGVETVAIGEKMGVTVKVEGRAWYISAENFVVEQGDNIGLKGFLV